MSKKSKNEECVFRVRTVEGAARAVTQWFSDCGATWTPVTGVFDPSTRHMCPDCERPLRVSSGGPQDHPHE